MRNLRTSVLVVGGGVVGLSTALFLARHGVAATLVERHEGTSIHPRAWGWYQRTMETYRWAGIEEEVLAAAAGYAGHNIFGKVESLVGKEISRVVQPPPEELDGITPCRHVQLGQDRLEPIVRRAAQDAGATLLFGTELSELEQDADGVTAVLRDRAGGAERTVRARYLIAADGARSPLRQRLGVAAHGRGTFRHEVCIRFGADLTGPLAGRRFANCQIQGPTLTALLAHDDTLREGTLMVGYRPQDGESAADFTVARCVELVRTAVGLPDLPVEIRAVLPWEMAALVAERYRVGRVFFAGDSAHVVPPVGGYGANTGVHDAHNLAWKLAEVLAGRAGDALLDSYAAERLPVATGTVEQAQLRLAVRGGFATDAERARMLEPLTVMLGHRYQGDGPFLPVERLRGQPGTRAPHLWLSGQDDRRSTLDLFGDGFVLLTGPGGQAWLPAAKRVADDVGVGLTGHPVADATGWASGYELPEDGAVLVRPDGFVSARWPGPPDADDEDGRTAALAVAVRAALEPPA